MENGGGDTGPASILLVEDDEASRVSTGELLRRAGYTVLLAPDYRLALMLLEGDQRIDLLVTDVVMPDRVNGMALARMARLRRPTIKLLYLTGYDIPGIEAEAMGPFLRKPVPEERLLAAIAGLIEAG